LFMRVEKLGVALISEGNAREIFKDCCCIG